MKRTTPNPSAELEEELDKISHGEGTYFDTVDEFYNKFMPVFYVAMEEMEEVPDEETGNICPQCGSKMVIKNGRFGEFEACSNFPECRYIPKAAEKEELKIGVKCPKCGEGDIIEKKSRGRRASVFYACNKYPKCQNTFTNKPINETCKECGELMTIDKKNEGWTGVRLE